MHSRGIHISLCAALALLSACGSGDNSAPSTASMQVQLVPEPIGKVPRPTYIPPAGWPSGAPAPFHYLVQNLGPGEATGVTVSVGVPAEVRVVEVQCAVPAGSAAQCPATAASAVVSVPTMPASSSLIFTVLAQPRTIQSVRNARVSLTATASNDIAPANNSWMFGARWWAADVRVAYAAPVKACPGTRIELSAQIQNLGPDTVDLDYLPGPLGTIPLEFRRCSDPSGAICGPGAYRGFPAPLDLFRIPAGHTWLVTYSADIPAGASGVLSSSLSYDINSDPNREDNVAIASVELTPAACPP